jgi:hypothetical protein
MPAVRSDEIWKVNIGGAQRTVKVIASSTSSGWWWCLDLVSGDMILAGEDSFIEQGASPPAEA